ncbi:MAG: peptidoglycan DD-metalloendopeptidase family protein [Clostridia bacterium]|nr:peptidoglycan DD-metalloendopeptidase family protein [Clostridia bacterium]
MKEKTKRFFRKNGYYLALIACVAVVFGAGIGILMQEEEPDQPVISYNTPVPNPGTPADPEGDATQDVFHPVTQAPEATPTPEQGPTTMVKPLEGDTQVDYSGKKLVFNKTTKEWRTHIGMDIAGTDGAPVYAACNGTVSAVKDDPRYGLTVILNHAGDVSTVYCGFSQVGVKEGAAVKAGDVLGTLGGEIFCEREQGLHLHFEVISGGSAVDPKEYWK